MGGTSEGAQELEALSAEPKKVKRLTGLALFSLSLFEMAAIVVAYEAMRYASTTGIVPVPTNVMATSYIAISALVVTLNGLLPICAHCKKVKGSEGYWHQIESYIGSRSKAVFRHGLCEVCVNSFLPEDADQAG